MKCIEIRDRKLVLTERPMPELKPGEVLVRVHAAGVNRPDLLQAKGLYPAPDGVTDIPGLEIAGEIVEGGNIFSAIRKGKKICALVAGGGYAEYCAVPAQQCLPLPHHMDYITAAGIPETFFTVWTNMFDSARLKKGDSVLVHGGASGIGTAAIQIARVMGIRIYVTAGSDDKCKACKKLGAAAAINYKTQDFVAEVMRATKGLGVDAVIDMVGGDYVQRNLKVLKIGGRHVSIAVQKGRMGEVDLAQIMQGRLIVTGSTLRPRSVAEKGKIARALYKHLWSRLAVKSRFLTLFAPKRIKPVIDKTFRLEDAQLAHDYLETGLHIGKVILEIRREDEIVAAPTEPLRRVQPPPLGL